MEQGSCYLLNIPDEVILNIVSRLPVEDVLSFSRSCKRINGLMKDNEGLWKMLVERDFGIVCENCKR